MRTLITNIKELLQVREPNIDKVCGLNMAILPSITNAYLTIDNNLISDFGLMINCPTGDFDKTINAAGKTVLPSWCDSHTHIVYAGNRVGEFADRISGLSYEQIANNGGGILNSAKKLQEIDETELFNQSKKRLYSLKT